MLKKGDFKIRLHGKKLNGDFALIHMRSRRPGTKGTEWLLIKKQDDAVVKGFDIDQYDESALTGRSMAEIAGDQGSAQWTSSRPASRGAVKAPWLADAIAKFDKKNKKKLTTEDTEDTEKGKAKKKEKDKAVAGSTGPAAAPRNSKTSSVSSVSSVVKDLEGAVKRPMPTAIHPMLATSVDDPFDDPEWLFEIKWDGYRAIAFIAKGKVRLVSRNQNDLTAQFSELQNIPSSIKADTAILDGEIAALDEQGRSSFSLMQQRTGIRQGGRRTGSRQDIPVLYYVFDLLYLDGYDLRRVSLEQRKEVLAQITSGDWPGALLRSFFPGQGAVRCGQTKGPGRHSGQAPQQCLRGAPQPRVAEDQNHPDRGLRHRRLHRSRGQPRIFRLTRAGPLRQEKGTHPCRPGRHRIRSGHAQGDLASAEEEGDKEQSLPPRSGSVAESALGQA